MYFVFTVLPDIPLYWSISVHQLIFGLFLLWTVINNAAMNICEQVFVWTCLFCRSGIPGSHGNFVFNLLRNCQAFLLLLLLLAVLALSCGTWDL